MNTVATFNPLNAHDWLLAFGRYAVYGVWFILFAETGLMIGFFLPGDSLLAVAGMVAGGALTDVHLNIWALLIGAPIFAIIGAQTGHWLGARYGTRLFDKPDSRFFKREYVQRAEHYFVRFGPRRAVVLARFIPIVRTFMNPVAGVLGMPARQFLLWNVVGAVLWVDGVILTTYFLADRIVALVGGQGQVDKYIVPFVLIIVLISAIPIFIEILRDRRAKRRSRVEASSAKSSAK